MARKYAKNPQFVSIIFTREPMARLVSAWKDKIYKRDHRQFYFSRYTREILDFIGRENIPTDSSTAWDQGSQCPVVQYCLVQLTL